MFSRTRERWNRLIAEAVPTKLAYYVALRVIAHAAVTKFEGQPANTIAGLDALEHWFDSRVIGHGRHRGRPSSPPLFRTPASDLEPVQAREIFAAPPEFDADLAPASPRATIP